MSTRKVAEKIVKHRYEHGEKWNLVDAIDEALRNERERCAKIADEEGAKMLSTWPTAANTANRIAALIRKDDTQQESEDVDKDNGHDH